MLAAATDFSNSRLFCFLAVLAAVLLFATNYAVTSRMTTLFLLRHTVTCLPSFDFRVQLNAKTRQVDGQAYGMLMVSSEQ
jgi:hypothetical protein